MDSEIKNKQNDEAEQAYIERLTAPPCPVKSTPEQIEELRKQGYKI